ncbi:hypothetical protein K491DRAFT_622911 [Lophiostoma macrostomum CBS 122681]|uniref:Bromo domain-containing protein n=1 Tax=Lophiostoma macrostomum CBS 122681 TaxID=1314788 RepID=A0A6A6TJ84_9PLEO|nr:hypothetical protein K491DRAFT_622911 [Lophiostoma macrostomum CBS 122681]
MTTSLTAYTPLESLLLFQSLNTYGVGSSIFSRISDLLKNNPTVTNAKSFQSGRLSPDALRNFYLASLKEEIKSEGHDGAHEGDGPNGDARNPRKRKAPSPSLQEAAQHAHLIPKLVHKLYARYRSAVTEQIRDEEDRYERLQRELASIERGERDGELVDRANGKSPNPRSPSITKKSPLLQQKPLSASPTPQLTLAPSNGQTPSDRGSKKTSPRKKPPPPPTPSTPQPAPAPNIPSHPSPGVPIAKSPSAPSQTTGSHASPSTTLPPAPQYHPQPIQPYGGNGVSQYGPAPSPAGAFPHANQRFQGQQYHMPPSPGTQTPSQQRTLVPQPLQPPQLPSQPPQMAQPPPQGGFMLPPFQVSPQDPSRAHQQAPQSYSQVSTPISRSSSVARPGVSTASAIRRGLPPLQPISFLPRSVVSTPLGQQTPYSAVSTPRSAKTLWKSGIKHLPAPSASHPKVEPIDDAGPPEPPKQSPPKAKAVRKTRAKGKAKEEEKEKPTGKDAEPEAEAEPDKMEEAVRPGRSRQRGATRRARRGSIASSQAGGSVRERSRSQSIISHTETIAADTESQAGTRVKSERGTPLDVGEEDSVGTPSQSRPKPRRRAGTVQPSQPRGRKRTAREASIAESEEQADADTPSFPKTIIAFRQFNKSCVPILDDIRAHKHGSLFSTAVKAKDAEGYHEIIKRPTDMNAIKKAVAAGSKAVTAAASDTPVGSPGGAGSMLQVPLTADVIPPKAIVNSSQLEKELMRMFANAVMFNPGEEGVVEDAREMSEACQRSLSNWRSAERERQGVGRVEIEETPISTQEDDAPAASKRRKL